MKSLIVLVFGLALFSCKTSQGVFAGDSCCDGIVGGVSDPMTVEMVPDSPALIVDLVNHDNGAFWIFTNGDSTYCDSNYVLPYYDTVPAIIEYADTAGIWFGCYKTPVSTATSTTTGSGGIVLYGSGYNNFDSALIYNHYILWTKGYVVHPSNIPVNDDYFNVYFDINMKLLPDDYIILSWKRRKGINTFGSNRHNFLRLISGPPEIESVYYGNKSN